MPTLPPSAPVVTDAPTVSPSIADRLEGAAALIEERGLAKHRLCDAQGRVCLRGAVHTAFTGRPQWPSPWDPTDCGTREYVMAAIRERPEGFAFSDPADWNNAPERTAAEVCAVLRRAASLSRAQVSA